MRFWVIFNGTHETNTHVYTNRHNKILDFVCSQQELSKYIEVVVSSFSYFLNFFHILCTHGKLV